MAENQTRTARELTATMTSVLSEVSTIHAQAVSELVLGRITPSAPTSEPSSTEQPEIWESKPDVWNSADMPPHIRATYEREAVEDSLMEMRSTLLSTLPTDSDSTTPDLPSQNGSASST